MKTSYPTTRQRRTPARQATLTSNYQPSIAVIGLGYVGLPLALQADRLGYEVIGVDIDEDRVKALQQHIPPTFLESNDLALAKEHTMQVTHDPARLSGVDVFIVCVPTPVQEDHEPDLEPLISACLLIAPYLRENSLVIIESTVNPGVCDEVVIPLLTRETGGLRVEVDYLFAYCPERVSPGDTIWDVRTIPRVLGTSGPKSTRAAYALYARIIEAPIHLMSDVKSAEAVKITENSFRDVNIAFVNELAMSFKKLDIDITQVLRGAATKPFGFMPHYPGCGVGGHCIPVDPYYLISYAKQHGFRHRFLETAREINNHMPFYTVDLLEGVLREKRYALQNTPIALLGLAYKANVPDDRESPAYVIAKELQRRGATVRSFDPYLVHKSSARSLEEALQDAVAVIIATNHTLFSNLAPATLKDAGVEIVIDGRNCLDSRGVKDAGITYHGIGR